MKASVVVPVRNGAQVIVRCLRALEQQTFPRQVYEVIVVDDGSTDDTAQVVRQFAEVRLLQQEPRGPAAARNRGVAAARGEFVLFTDADCAPTPTWVESLVKALERSGAAGGKGTYVTHQRGLAARFVQVEYETKYRRMAQHDSIDFIDTYSAAYRRSVLEAVGGFDERFPAPSVEDQELSFRVAGQGYRLVFVPAAVVDHLHAASLRAYARKKFRIGYWKALALQEHPGKIAKDAHTPQLLKVEMVLTALLIPAGAASLILRSSAPLLVTLATLALSWSPFLLYTAQRDAPVLAIAPLMLLARAAALGSGLIWGAFRLRRTGMLR